MEPDLTWVYSTLSAAGGATVTWIFSRKKQKAETVQTELDNVQKAVEIWRQTAEDLKKRGGTTAHRSKRTTKGCGRFTQRKPRPKRTSIKI
jgi:hypothetical protein